MKFNVKQSIGFGISLILVYFLIFHPRPGLWIHGDLGFVDALFGETRFGLEDLVQAGGMLRAGPVVLAVALLIVSLFLRAWRWQLIIKPVGHAGFGLVFWSINVGYLLNNILPFRAGELIRGILVAKRAGLSAGSLVATVLLERIFDLVGLGMVFCFTLVLYPFPQWIRYSGGVMTAGLIAVLLAGWLLSRSSEKVEKWINDRTSDRGKMLRKTGSLTINLIRGLEAFRHGGVMLKMIVSTALLWVMYLWILKTALDAFSFTDGRYPLLQGQCFLQSAVITIVTSLGMGLPSSPGAVGTYHGAVVLSLSWFEVPEAMSVVFAAALHALTYVSLTVAGLLGLWRLKISWSWIMDQVKARSG